MISTPCPDHRRLRKTFNAVMTLALFLMAGPLMAGSIHHFSLDVPNDVIANQDVTIQISAIDENGELASAENRELNLKIYMGPELSEQSIDLEDGVAKLTLNFPNPIPVMIDVVDRADPYVTGSIGFPVKRDMTEAGQ